MPKNCAMRLCGGRFENLGLRDMTELLTAAQMAERYPSLAPLTDLHLAQSLGRTPSDPQGSIRHLKGLDQEIRRQHPLWKLILGWLNPFSWIRVK
mgnify:CR=1 FL=1